MPKQPDRPLDIHLIAIGGTGMAPLACLLRGRGHHIRGSDLPLYPPMSTLLSKAGITPYEGYDVGHLDPQPDLVVVGNAVPRENPEAEEAERLGLARVSMPEALAQFFLDGRRPLVVAGTHGKTTTTALAAWVYSCCGEDPGYLIGGVPVDLGRSFHEGRGERFIIEGDEYNAAYFDRGPKFLHYRPNTLILTSVEYDHADLYPDPESLVTAFEKLVGLLPSGGLLVACGDSPEVRQVAEHCAAPVLFYGLGSENHVHPLGPIDTGAEGSRFRLAVPEGEELDIAIPLSGEHNLANALAVWVAACRDGLAPDEVAAALKSFGGVKRRLEELGTIGGVSVIDDFAHHPTAVDMTLVALKQRYPSRRMVAVYEPRSLTAGRAQFLDPYLNAFGHADLVFLAPIYHASRLLPDEQLDIGALTTRLAEGGTQAHAVDHLADLPDAVLDHLRPGDVVVIMSSGDFGNLPQRLLDSLRQKEASASSPID